MARGFIFGVLLLTAALPSHANQDRPYRLAMNNLGHETIECAAYYWIMSELMKTRPDSADLVKKSLEVSAALFERAITIADGIGQKREAVVARFEISAKGMRDAIGGDATNTSILLNRYSGVCKTTTEDVAARIKYWMDQAIQEESRQSSRK